MKIDAMMYINTGVAAALQAAADPIAP